MTLSKSSKDYAAGRIRAIATEAIKAIHPTESPCLLTFIRASILEGTAKLKPSKEIIEHIQRQISGCGSYREERFGLKELFAEPATYKQAVKDFESEQKKTESRREEINSSASSIIDDLMLDQFDKGQTAIEKMKKLVAKK